MHDVSCDFAVEPTLHALQCESFIHKTTSTDENAQLDVKTNGLWGSRFRRYFFDVKIVDPLPRSCPKNSVEAYKCHESLKCLEDEHQILDVEKSNFVPLVFSCMGATGPSATRTIKQLASRIAEKKDESHFGAITYIRTKISFAFLRSALIWLRGCLGSKGTTEIDSFCLAIVRRERLDSKQISLYRN